MKFFLFSLIFLLIDRELQAQNQSNNTITDTQNIRVNTDREPGFVKGEMALYKIVSESIAFSDEAIVNAVKGQVMLSFDVMPDSTVKNVSVISGPGFGTEEAVKSVLEKQKFIPAMQNGVLVKMNLVMNFPVRAH